MIAIDFGTSRTKLAYFDADRGAARLMGLSRRDDPFMSSLFYLGPDGRRLLGDDAEQMLEVDPGGVIDRLKRSLRRPTVRRNRQKVSPTVLLTLLLADLRTRAGEELPTLAGVVPKELTLTVPCRYGPPEEEILRRAAAAAGFEQVALMSEPEAAARAWEREVGGSGDAVVVLDCGGGSTNWAYLARRDGALQLFAGCPPGGDREVGGYGLDLGLLNLVRERLEDEGAAESVDHVNERAAYHLSRLRRLKERFCRHERMHRADRTFVVRGQALDLNPETLNHLFADRFVKQVCQGFGRYLDQVRSKTGTETPRVLLVGGSSRVLGLKEALAQSCNCETVWWERSEFATVLGASRPAEAPI